MEADADFIGALSAGKMPTQSQMNYWIDYAIRQIDVISNVSEDPSLGTLSDYGQRLMGDLKQVLLAHKELGTSKNSDDILQSALYDLSRGKLLVDARLQTSQKEALSDAVKALDAFQEVTFVFLQHLTSTEGGLGDLASLVRTFLADTAGVVEQHASTVKSELHQTEAKVQDGKRDPLGRQVSEAQPDDVRQCFEREMDAANTDGSNIIGGGQAVKQSAEQPNAKASRDAENFVENLLIHAENDESYRRAVLTLIDLASKWINKSVESVDKDIINDPTGRISHAIICCNTLLERLANKSTDNLLNALRITARDVREDPDLKQFFDDLHAFMRRSPAEPTFLRSDQYVRYRQDLSERWRKLQTGEHHSKWHDDMKNLRHEYRDFFARIENDPGVKKLHEASVIFGKDLTEAALTLQEAFLGNANWLWADIMDVYIPRALDWLKEIPVPRVEYKDSDVEFVVEDLILDTLKLFPGRAKLHNATGFEVSKSSANKSASTNVRSYTNVELKGIQLKVEDVSFWYNDSTMLPEISGLLGVNIPKEGFDVELALTLQPQPEKKDAYKENRHAFFNVEKVRVRLNNPELVIRKSNHPILFSAFMPIIRSRIEKAIENTMQRQIALSVECIDNVMFEIYSRARVFADTGIPWSASCISAIWSEIGHLKGRPGLFSGVHTTSVGIIKDDPCQDVLVAIGARPQIIAGRKHGPVAPGSNSHGKRDQAIRLKEESLCLGEESARLGEEGLPLGEQSARLGEESLRLEEESLRLEEESLRLGEESFRFKEESFCLKEESLCLGKERSPLVKESLRLAKECSRLAKESSRLDRESLRLDEEGKRLGEPSPVIQGALEKRRCALAKRGRALEKGGCALKNKGCALKNKGRALKNKGCGLEKGGYALEKRANTLRKKKVRALRESGVLRE